MTTILDKAEADKLRAAGWSVVDAGWPDALAYRRPCDGVIEAVAVDWKRERDVPTSDQIAAGRVLVAIGVPYALAFGAEGLRRVPPGVLPDRTDSTYWCGVRGPVGEVFLRAEHDWRLR